MPQHDSPIPPSDGVLDRYLAGEATAAERQVVDAWAERHRHRGGLLAMLGGSHMRGTPNDYVALDQRIQREMAAFTWQKGASVGRSPWTQNRNTTRWLTLVAGAVLLAVISVVSQRDRIPRANPSSASQGAFYTTRAGQRATLIFANGNRVVLASRTTLRMIDDATAEVIGEAYFSIVRHTSQPFVVRTGIMTTRVLGTAFDVRYDAGDSTAHIAVVSGKVVVSPTIAPNRAFTLNAGTVASVKDSSVIATVTSAVADYVAWVDGHLVFGDAPVPNMLAAVGRWYGVEFHLADSTLATRHVTTTLDCSSTAVLMATLKVLLDVNMTFDGTHDGVPIITLHARHNRQTSPTKSWQRLDTFTTSSELGR